MDLHSCSQAESDAGDAHRHNDDGLPAPGPAACEPEPDVGESETEEVPTDFGDDSEMDLITRTPAPVATNSHVHGPLSHADAAVLKPQPKSWVQALHEGSHREEAPVLAPLDHSRGDRASYRGGNKGAAKGKGTKGKGKDSRRSGYVMEQSSSSSDDAGDGQNNRGVRMTTLIEEEGLNASVSQSMKHA